MNVSPIRVLLVSDGAHAFAVSQRRLEKNGCQCHVAKSHAEVARKLGRKQFDIILSTRSARDGNLTTLTAMLVGSCANLFCALPIEAGCLWLPILRNGDECLGRPFLRPNEFATELDKIVGELRNVGAVTPFVSNAA